MKRWYGLIGAGAFAIATMTTAFAASSASGAANPGNTVPSTQAKAAPASRATARHSISRKKVEAIQTALNNNGESVSVDGLWGAKTSAALKDFQQKHGLKATGHIDRMTLGELKVTTHG